MRFLDLSKQRWTVFWQQIGVNIPRRTTKLKSYKWSGYKARFERIGVAEATAEKLNSVFSLFQEPALQIIRFWHFFTKDRELIQGLLGAKNVSAACDALISKFETETPEQVRGDLERLKVFGGLELKGHGERYKSELPSTKKLEDFDIRRIQARLARNPKLNPVRYRLIPPARLAGWLVFPIRKTIGKDKWFIFLQLKTAADGKLSVRMTVDSEYERRLFLSEISGWCGSFIHGIEETVDFKSLMDFIKQSGESQNFTLDSVSFIDGDYVLSVERKFRRFRTTPMTPHRHMKFIKEPVQLSKLVLRSKSDELSGRPLIIPVSTPYNSRVRGAISFKLVDRNLRVRHSEKIQSDFLSDFKVTLGAFVTYGTIKEKMFCELFLQNDVRRKSRIGKISLPLRMPPTSDLWLYHRELIQSSILFPEKTTEYTCKYCFNRNCGQAFRPQLLTRTTCDGCQDPLYDKTELTTGNISEEGFARWLANQALASGCDSVSLGRKKLLGKKLYLVEVVRRGSRQLYLPVTGEWKEQDREILSRRMPDVCVLTSGGNEQDFVKSSIAAVALHELYYDLRFIGKDRLLKYSQKVEEKAIRRIQERAEEASKNLASDAYYLGLNKAGKNIGAEMFEADCSTLLRYMFGAARWLGASSRGLAVPDGCSAFPCFPSIGIADGFFVWDTKFTSSSRSRIGGPAKNKVYVASMYKDPIARGARCRGLLFISNKPEPTTFRQAARRIVGRRRVRVAYLQATELLRIFQHFQTHEEIIGDKEAAKKVFFGFMKELLTAISRKKGGKVVIISPDRLGRLIKANEKALRKLAR